MNRTIAAIWVLWLGILLTVGYGAYYSLHAGGWFDILGAVLIIVEFFVLAGGISVLSLEKL